MFPHVRFMSANRTQHRFILSRSVQTFPSNNSLIRTITISLSLWLFYWKTQQANNDALRRCTLPSISVLKIDSILFRFPFILRSAAQSCLVGNGGCSDTCKTMSVMTSSTKQYMCSCPTGFQLWTDGHTCVGKPTSLHKSCQGGFSLDHSSKTTITQYTS